MNGSVDDMMKTPGGRERLARLQKVHEIDILQPSDPRFKKVYGDKIKKREEAKAKAIDASKGEWERSAWEKAKDASSIDKKKIVL